MAVCGVMYFFIVGMVGFWFGFVAMKKKEQIQMLRERVAALEGRLTGLEGQNRSLADQVHQKNRMVFETWCRTAEVLRVTWEALRATGLRHPPHEEAGDEAQETPRSPQGGRGRAKDA